MFLMRNKLVLFITGCFALLITSCLDEEEIGDIDIVKNCQLNSFQLSHDSVPGLDTVKFTIDQLSGKIFNMDSLPYGTKLEKVVCKMTTANGFAVAGIEVSPEAYADSSYYLKDLTDSIDFSAPVKIVVHSYDKLTTKVYRAQVNIHQLIPDSMVWEQYSNPMIGIAIKEQKVIAFSHEDVESYFMYVKPADKDKGYHLYHAPATQPKGWKALELKGLPTDGLVLSQVTEYGNVLYVPSVDGKLYSSKDGISWNVMEKTPQVKYLLGTIDEGKKQKSALAAIINSDGKDIFASMTADSTWQNGETVPAGFPVKGFGNLKYDAMYHEYLMVAGGRTLSNNLVNTTWATMDGRSWSLMASENNRISKREGAALIKYDGKFMLIGGVDGSNKGLKDMYQSIDYGINWTKIDTLMTLPTKYTGRGFSSVVVDKENNVNMFGGKVNASANDINDLWRGRLNRLIPKVK